MAIDPPIAGKWVQVLKQAAPFLRRAVVLFDPEVAPFAGEFFRQAEEAARPLALDLSAAAVRDVSEINDAFTTVASETDTGLIVMADAFMSVHRELIVALAARHRVPAIYPYRYYVTDGALMSYGIEFTELFERAALCIDRILRGERASELPVQAPTNFSLVVNLRTAKALGLVLPESFLLRADEVIE